MLVWSFVNNITLACCDIRLCFAREGEGTMGGLAK